MKRDKNYFVGTTIVGISTDAGFGDTIYDVGLFARVSMILIVPSQIPNLLFSEKEYISGLSLSFIGLVNIHIFDSFQVTLTTF
jgi:hypothetical protein